MSQPPKELMVQITLTDALRFKNEMTDLVHVLRIRGKAAELAQQAEELVDRLTAAIQAARDAAREAAKR